jgi:tRNA-specific 2-thiouridylase
LRRSLGDRPGAVVDANGTVLGEHDGSFAFTVGQRKGLRLDRPAPDGRPRYVLDIAPLTSTVTVGSHEQLTVSWLEASRLRWCGRPATGPFSCRAQLRAHGEELAAVTEVLPGDTVRVALVEPAYGVAPGQSVVLYDGTRVVASATVDRTGG